MTVFDPNTDNPVPASESLELLEPLLSLEPDTDIRTGSDEAQSPIAHNLYGIREWPVTFPTSSYLGSSRDSLGGHKPDSQGRPFPGSALGYST